MIEKLLPSSWYTDMDEPSAFILNDKINELVEAVNRLEKEDDGSGLNEGDGYRS